MIEQINNILDTMNNFMYSYLLIALLVGTGLYFSIKTKFVQLRLFKNAMKVISEKPNSLENKNSVSSFQALMISTASRVGTGNIAGIATAIASGGAGSVFWMWLMAIIGGSSAFVESTLAQVYKVKDDKEFRGGPSYYMEKALGKRALGVLFSILLIICFAYGFNALQTYNMSSSLAYYISDYNNSIYPYITGLIIALLASFVIFGGSKIIGKVTSFIVPIMSILYLFLAMFIVIKNISSLPAVFALIFKEAFNLRAIFGGFTGSAVVIGIKRGLFSNEAGMGSAPNAAASANVSHPAKQGLVQVISLFIDTLLICSATAMILLLSKDASALGLNGIPFVQVAIASNVGEIGIHFITVAIFLFAFTSLLGNYYYAQSNLLFIWNNKICLFIFRISCVVAIFFGASSNFALAWNFADVSMGLMAIVNIVSILFLGRIAIKVLKDYESKLKDSDNPIFKAKELGIENAECWD